MMLSALQELAILKLLNPTAHAAFKRAQRADDVFLLGRILAHGKRLTAKCHGNCPVRHALQVRG